MTDVVSGGLSDRISFALVAEDPFSSYQYYDFYSRERSSNQPVLEISGEDIKGGTTPPSNQTSFWSFSSIILTLVLTDRVLRFKRVKNSD